MLCAKTPNSRDKAAALRPAATNSTICCPNSTGYGGLAFLFSLISDSFTYIIKVSVKTGEIQSIRRWRFEMGVLRYARSTRLLITADSGGSFVHRARLWRVERKNWSMSWA